MSCASPFLGTVTWVSGLAGHLCQLEDGILAIEDTGWRGREGGALLRLSVPA